MTKREITALLMMLEHQNRLLVDYASKIQAIETFLREQPENASLPRKTENDPSAATIESDLRSSLQELEKALSGRP
jgi:hypothetical protein